MLHPNLALLHLYYAELSLLPVLLPNFTPTLTPKLPPTLPPSLPPTPLCLRLLIPVLTLPFSHPHFPETTAQELLAVAPKMTISTTFVGLWFRLEIFKKHFLRARC